MNDEELNDRLARLRAEQADPEQHGQQGAIGRAAGLWTRYSRRRKRGDALLAMTAVLIAGVVIAATVVLIVSLASGSGDKQPASAIGAQRTPTEARRETATLTTAPIETPPPATEAPLVRQDCDAIRGTSYESEAERDYFQQNCLEPDGNPAPVTNPTRPPSAPTSAPPAGQPTSPPTATQVPGGSAASNAIALAVDWITHHGTESYTTDAGSCNALQTSGHWVVTCNARVTGCQGSVCNAIVSVCVLTDLSAVRPSEQC